MTEQEELELLRLRKRKAMALQQAPTSEAPGLMSRVSTNLGQAADAAFGGLAGRPLPYRNEGVPQPKNLVESVPTRALLTAGGLGGALGDVAGAGLGLVARGVGSIPMPGRGGQNYGQGITQILGDATPGIKKAIDSPVGRTLGKMGSMIKKSWQEDETPADKELWSNLADAADLDLAGVVTTPIRKAIYKKAGKKALGGAARVQGTKVKINSPEMKQGAKNAYYTKYGVFGNADQVKGQWKEKITDASTKLKAMLTEASADPATKIDLLDAFTDAEKQALANTRTDKIKVRKAFRQIEDELLDTYGGSDGMIDLLEAQMLKRDVGKKGDWLDFNGRMSGNEDAPIKAKAYNSFYNTIKKSLEDKGPAGIKELNTAMSEMIPMERAAAKASLVANRKNPISLDDYIGGLAITGSAMTGNLLPAAMVGTNVASKSPSIAKGLYKAGKKLTDLGTRKGSIKNTLGNLKGATPTVGGATLGGIAGYQASEGDSPEKRAAMTLGGIAVGGLGGKVAGGVAGRRMLKNQGGQISVWHGSPHKFDKFQMDKLGTGEGAQAFGHGLYFTNQKDIARNYANALGTTGFENFKVGNTKIYENGLPIDYSPKGRSTSENVKAKVIEDLLINEYKIKEAFSNSDKEGLKAIQEVFDDNIESAINEAQYDKRYSDEALSFLRENKPKNIKDIEKNIVSNKNLYKATIHKGKKPSEYDYLKWDKKINNKTINKIINHSEQQDMDGVFLSDDTIDFLKKYTTNKKSISGQELYQLLSNELDSEKAASDFLLRSGVDGIDYPAGSLSGGGEGRNYVVFDENAITIEDLSQLQ